MKRRRSSFSEEGGRSSGLQAEKVWGEVIEDRGSQITFSALGQQAPLEEKEQMGPRLRQAEEDQSDPRHFDSRVFRPHGWRDIHRCHQAGHRQSLRNPKAARHLGISLKEMIFIGDALFPGGNDYPAEQAGVVSIRFEVPTRRSGLSKQSSLVSDHDQEG
jgi:phosphomannomutase